MSEVNRNPPIWGCVGCRKGGDRCKDLLVSRIKQYISELVGEVIDLMR